MIKKDYESNQGMNTEAYLKKKKVKRENMEKTDIIIYLKKSNKTQTNINKITERLKY